MAYKVAEVLKILEIKLKKGFDSKVRFFMKFNLEEAVLVYDVKEELKIVALLDK